MISLGLSALSTGADAANLLQRETTMSSEKKDNYVPPLPMAEKSRKRHGRHQHLLSQKMDYLDAVAQSRGLSGYKAKSMSRSQVIEFILEREFPEGVKPDSADVKHAGGPKVLYPLWPASNHNNLVSRTTCTLCRAVQPPHLRTLGLLREAGWMSSGGGNAFCPTCVGKQKGYAGEKKACTACNGATWQHGSGSSVLPCQLCNKDGSPQKAQELHDNSCAFYCNHQTRSKELAKMIGHRVDDSKYGFSHRKECVDRANNKPVSNLGNVVGFQLRKVKEKPLVFVDDMSEPP